MPYLQKLLHDHKLLATAFGEAEAAASPGQAAAAAGKALKANEDEPPSSIAGQLDAKTDAEHAAAQEPVGGPTDKPPSDGPEAFEPDEQFDPRIPRIIDDGFSLTKRGSWDMRPFGLRAVGKRLFACDSDDDAALADHGRCGVVGTRGMIDGISLLNPITNIRVLPVHRWDTLRQRWTAEEAPYISVPDWKLPRSGDGKVDLSKMPLMPRSMMQERPGQLPPAIEGSLGLPACCIALAAPPLAAASRPTKDGRYRRQTDAFQDFLYAESLTSERLATAA